MAYKASVVAVFAAFASLVNTRGLQIPLTADTQPSIPLLGYGTWNLDRSNISDAVSLALQSGYRHIDGAAAYGNQEDVGKGIADGLNKAGLKRSDIWVTSKLWNDHHGADKVEEGLDTTLEELGLGYLDLYLMHWPVSSSGGANTLEYLESWHALEKLLDTGKVRYIGVSNFDPPQLKDLIEHSHTKPAVHQFELHPYLQQTNWVQWHKDHGIHVTAYSPLANLNPTYGTPGDKEDVPPLLLDNEIIGNIAFIRGCTPVQVVLAWGIHRGTSVIPKSSNPLHIKENFRSISCVLQESDYEDITKLGKKYLKRFNNPSDGWGVPLFEGLDGA